jgi:hypothetical protein
MVSLLYNIIYFIFNKEYVARHRTTRVSVSGGRYTSLSLHRFDWRYPRVVDGGREYVWLKYV